jgi:hypothetical protein
MINKYSSEQPAKVEQIRNGYKVNYNIRETTSEELLELWKESGRSEFDGNTPTKDFADENKYVYNSVNVPMGQWNYGGIVNAIIRDKYTIDEMESITNNMAAINAVYMQTLVTEGIVGAIQYLRDSYDKDNADIFKQMQEWRAMAKKEAKSIFVNG